MNWKLKIIANHVLEFLGSRYRYVFYFEGSSDNSKLLRIEFRKYTF